MATPDSGIGALNKGDGVRAVIVGALTAGFATAGTALLGGGASWPVLAVAFVSGVMGYLTKNLGTASNGKFLGKFG